MTNSSTSSTGSLTAAATWEIKVRRDEWSVKESIEKMSYFQFHAMILILSSSSSSSPQCSNQQQFWNRDIKSSQFSVQLHGHTYLAEIKSHTMSSFVIRLMADFWLKPKLSSNSSILLTSLNGIERLEEARLKVSSIRPRRAHFCFSATSFRARSGCWLHCGWMFGVIKTTNLIGHYKLRYITLYYV